MKTYSIFSKCFYFESMNKTKYPIFRILAIIFIFTICTFESIAQITPIDLFDNVLLKAVPKFAFYFPCFPRRGIDVRKKRFKFFVGIMFSIRAQLLTKKPQDLVVIDKKCF